MQFKFLIGLLFGLCFGALAYAEVTIFSPAPGTEVVLTLGGSSLAFSVVTDGHSESKIITFEAESDLRIQIDDFNFDGIRDFAVWQVDDGMGTYNIHRIFVYQPKTGSFQELQPDCGDGFVNLRVDGKHKALISTYWEMNVPKQCTTRFAKRKAW